MKTNENATSGQTAPPAGALAQAAGKAAVLVEAMPYIRAFQHRYIVIKLGGSAQDDPAVLRGVLADADFMLAAGLRPVVVYGGGKKISRAMKEMGREAVFVQGQRVTDPETMAVVARVLAGDVGQELLGLLAEAGGVGECLNGRDHQVLRAVKKTLPERPDVDLGCVGEPVAIDATRIHRLFERYNYPDGRTRLPLIAPVACGCGREQNQLYNVNGDTAAALIARDLHAEKLVFLSDIPGVYRDRNDPASLEPHLDRAGVERMMKAGQIEGGMIPKAEACLFALEGGVKKAHIIPAGQPHALLLEIFTQAGVGTEIVLGADGG